MPGLPIGTRGGVAVPYTFAENGEYDIQVWLARSLEGNVSGLREPRPHEMILLIDREPVATFTIQKSADVADTVLDRDLKTRVAVSAGPHELAVTFVKEGSSLLETGRQPLQSHYNDRRHPRITPAIDQVSVTGPYEAKGAGNTPSRRRLFVCQPEAERAPGRLAGRRDEETCAKEILTTLMRRAYRRPISKADVEGPMAFYREGRAGGDFEAGIGRALSAVLINPEFLFRVEADPKKTPPAAPTESAISSWHPGCRSSCGAASRTMNCSTRPFAEHSAGPEELEKQTRRMLADRRSFNLATNFAGQWLRLRNLEAVNPNAQSVPGLR